MGKSKQATKATSKQATKATSKHAKEATAGTVGNGLCLPIPHRHTACWLPQACSETPHVPGDKKGLRIERMQKGLRTEEMHAKEATAGTVGKGICRQSHTACWLPKACSETTPCAGGISS